MTNAKPRRVLFVDDANAGLSILAEGLLAMASRGRLSGFSAGCHPASSVHPLALEQLNAYCMESHSFHGKHWQSFAGVEAEPLDFIIGLGDTKVAGLETDWPGNPQLCDWPLRDPLAAQMSEEELRMAFARAFSELGRRIYIFANLPFAELSASQLRRELDALGDLCEIGK